MPQLKGTGYQIVWNQILGWKTQYFFFLEDSVFLTCKLITKLIHRFNITPIKIPARFFFFLVEIGKLTNDSNGNAKGLKELKRKKRKENFEKLKVRKGKKKNKLLWSKYWIPSPQNSCWSSPHQCGCFRRSSL